MTYFNEVFEAGGEVREPYGPLSEVLERIGAGELARRGAVADEKLRELGATFPLPGDPAGKDRILPADWTPRIIPRDHWERLSAGLVQRGRAINAWVTDLYNGAQDIVPQEIIQSNIYYRARPLPGCAVPNPIRVYGPDVVHLEPGKYVVLEDNVRVPSGVAYSEAVRRAGLEVLGELYEPYRACGIFAYYHMLRRTLEAAAPAGVEEPCLAVVTRGEGDSAYFEHRRIAEACGMRLLTLADCYVQDGEVRDRADGRRIDAIYRRFDEDYVSTELPELEELYQAGRVSFENAFGVGVADDKAVFPYVPTMIERYLEEEPVLENVPTLSLSEPEQREEALERLEELVLKPREGYGGQGIVIGPEADREDLENARRAAKENPTAFVAQETLDFSTHVLGWASDDPGPVEAFVDLRAFVLPAEDYVLPGGLTRVASPGTRVVNSSAGGSFKDTLVLED